MLAKNYQKPVRVFELWNNRNPAKEAAMQLALSQLAQLTVVKEISNFVRVENM